MEAYTEDRNRSKIFVNAVHAIVLGERVEKKRGGINGTSNCRCNFTSTKGGGS